MRRERMQLVMSVPVMDGLVMHGRGHGRLAARMLAVAGSLLLAGGLLAGCGLVGAPTTFQGEFTVTSPVVSKGVIPLRYTCHGDGLSPPLHWSGAPAGTKTLALVVDDADAPITPYIYWIVFDINPTTTDIQAGERPTGARQADNSAGHAAYDPPCPGNKDHSYRFTVYALHSAVSLPNGTDLKAAWLAISRATIAHGRLPVIAKP
ncbi:MAG TPA: YbhB/YbcL family Raf kinase inhibitor-like protein [Streptosporangiaceae bacterium]|nr:YbhB/YbcL family Raf kinase inhibitor-like protein [Streptosporangiaceae bacterium]